MRLNLSTLKSQRGLVLVLGVAAFLRFFLLQIKPPHFDEGVNGWFTDQVIANGFYRYDPTNYHGPLHFYILWIFELLFGRSIAAFRAVPVLFNLLTIYWIFQFERFFGKRTVFFAALAMAVSPAMVFYSRYNIHESEFVFFQVLALWGTLGLFIEGQSKYLWAVTLALAGMVCTKETYVIHIVCLLVAWLCLRAWERLIPSVTQTTKVAPQRWDSDMLLWCVVAFVGVVIFFYTGGLLYPKGMDGLREAMGAWFKTGVKGNGHDKPFWYWVRLFGRYEQITLLGLAAGLRFLFPSSRWLRWIAIYGLGVFLVYSYIPYKTPWCTISLIWPFCFIFGAVIDEIISSSKSAGASVRALAGALVVASTALTVKLNFFEYTNDQEPYVYVQTYQDIFKFTKPVLELAQRDVSNYNTNGHIIVASNWPLPWILGGFTHVGYFGPSLFPAEFDADFLLVDESRVARVEASLTKKYFTDMIRIRSAMEPVKIYLEAKRFQPLFPGREPEFKGAHKEKAL